MPMSQTCEVRYGDEPWHLASVQEAFRLRKGTAKRCIQCHGSVRAHRATKIMDAHFEHMRGHPGCPLSVAYDGNGTRPHPLALS
jgi:nitrate reductase cytochrome c-type subunit